MPIFEHQRRAGQVPNPELVPEQVREKLAEVQRFCEQERELGARLHDLQQGREEALKPMRE